MKTKLTSYRFLFIGIILMILGSCVMTQVPESSWLPEFRSVSAEVSAGNVVLTAKLSTIKGVISCGFYCGLSKYDMQKVSANMDYGVFSYTIMDAEPGREYHYQAFIGNGHDFIYSDVSRFRVPELSEEPGTGTEDPGKEDPGAEDPGKEDPGAEDPDDPVKDDPGMEYSLSLPFAERFFPVEASSLEIEVGGNADFEVSEPMMHEEVVDWVRCERDGRVCSFHADENLTSQIRWCQIEFRSLDHDCVCLLSLYQVGGGIELSSYEIVAGPETGAYHVELYNVNAKDLGYGIPPSDGWISVGFGNSGFTLKVMLDRNPLTTDRSGQICLFSDKLGMDCLVDVVQKGRDEELPEQVCADVEIPYDQTGFTVTADNVDPSSSVVRIPAGTDWVWYESSDGNAFSFSLAENHTGLSRSARITIMDKFYFSYIVNLTQLSAPQE